MLGSSPLTEFVVGGSIIETRPDRRLPRESPFDFGSRGLGFKALSMTILFEDLL